MFRVCGRVFLVWMTPLSVMEVCWTLSRTARTTSTAEWRTWTRAWTRSPETCRVCQSMTWQVSCSFLWFCLGFSQLQCDFSAQLRSDLNNMKRGLQGFYWLDVLTLSWGPPIITTVLSDRLRYLLTCWCAETLTRISAIDRLMKGEASLCLLQFTTCESKRTGWAAQLCY